METFDTKIVLHIPHFAFSDGGLVEIDCYGFCKALCERMNGNGITDWYETNAFGRYKGRRYDQELWTLFVRPDQKDVVLESFREMFSEWNDVLQQEAFAYELNGVLHVESAT